MSKASTDIVETLFEDLLSRRGFRQAWDDCDKDIKIEIAQAMAAMIDGHPEVQMLLEAAIDGNAHDRHDRGCMMCESVDSWQSDAPKPSE